MANGDSIDNAQLANLKQPLKTMKINGMDIDMQRFAEAAQALDADRLDVLTIDGYRNSKGEWVPNYDSVRIVKRDKE